jgi:uncharacterized membrane protein HdeD (DUF308 family)
MPTSVPSPEAPSYNTTPANRKVAIGELRHRWGWFVALGVAMVLLGVVAMLNMLVATVASVYTVGVLMLVGAAVQIAHAFSVKSWSSFFLWVLGGIIYAIAGFAALINPLMASAILTLFLAAALLVSGAMRVWIGLIIALGWPVNSLWVLGLFLAIDLTFQGWAMIAFGMALRSR